MQRTTIFLMLVGFLLTSCAQQSSDPASGGGFFFPECATAVDCDDENPCTIDACGDGNCEYEPAVCSQIGFVCDQATGDCICDEDSDCDDGEFCNGAEICDAPTGSCTAGVDPCRVDQECGEASATCLPSVDYIQDATRLVLWGTPGAEHLDGGSASAFAVSPNLFATNAHVAQGIRDFFENSAHAEAFLLQHETGTLEPIRNIWVHPEYDANAQALTTPDVGLLGVSANIATEYLTLATQQSVQEIQVFDRVAMCGYPGTITLLIDILNSLLNGGNLRPRATCYSGEITALRPFNPSEPATPENSYLIQHDLPTERGTSGSPIFDDRGDVIAVHFAGLNPLGGEAQFGIRSDKLRELISFVDAGASATVLDNLRPAACASDLYEPFWRVGIDLTSSYSGPFDATEFYTDLGVWAAWSYELSSLSWIDVQVYPPATQPIDEDVELWIDVVESFGYSLSEHTSFVAINGERAHFLKWVFLGEPGFQDLHVFESFTFGYWGAYVVSAYVWEEELTAFASVLEAAVRSVCTD